MISVAHAQAAGPFGGADGLLGSLLPIFLIFAVIYFFMIRPQSKRQKEHKAMVEALQKGDKVITSGGIVGKVTKVIDNNEIVIEIAKDTEVTVLRYAITQVLNKKVPNGSEGEKKEESVAKRAKASKKKETPQQETTESTENK